jgi:hypothetical protein
MWPFTQRRPRLEPERLSLLDTLEKSRIAEIDARTNVELKRMQLDADTMQARFDEEARRRDERRKVRDDMVARGKMRTAKAIRNSRGQLVAQEKENCPLCANSMTNNFSPQQLFEHRRHMGEVVDERDERFPAGGRPN